MQRETRAALLCSRFRDLAPDILGEDAGKEIAPKFFKGNTLYIRVPNNIWAQRVYVHRHELIMKLNTGLEKDYVHEIRAVVEPEIT